MIVLLSSIVVGYIAAAFAARPAIGAYYKERYGEDWETLSRDWEWRQGCWERKYFHYDMGDYMYEWMITPILYLGIAAQVTVQVVSRPILAALAYPGKRLAMNLKKEESMRQLPAREKDQIDKEAEEEVERLLSKRDS